MKSNETKGQEVLRVTAEGEFVWHPDAYELIEHGDFKNAPGAQHLLRRLLASEVVDNGPWSAWSNEETGSAGIQSDDFTHDVYLTVYGDFEYHEQKLQYAEYLASVLNTREPLVDAKENDMHNQFVYGMRAAYQDAIRLVENHAQGYHEPVWALDLVSTLQDTVDMLKDQPET